MRLGDNACRNLDLCGVQLMEIILHVFKRSCARLARTCVGPSHTPSLILGHGKCPSHPPVVWKKSCMSESPPHRRPTLMVGGLRGRRHPPIDRQCVITDSLTTSCNMQDFSINRRADCVRVCWARTFCWLSVIPTHNMVRRWCDDSRDLAPSLS